MNSVQNRSDSKYWHNGAQQIDNLLPQVKWAQVGQRYARDGRSDSAAFQSSYDQRLFLTPYARECFAGTLPALPADLKAENVVVVTDLDAELWHQTYDGPPADAFKDLTNPLYEAGKIDAWARLDVFFEKSFTRNMRHMPKVLFSDKIVGDQKHTAAIVVLSVHQSAHYHIQQMAGIGCLPEMESLDKGEIHEAIKDHEWFHLSEDSHLSDAQVEIGADQVALDGVITPSLKQAWIDARIVGGFMWPFAGRQNGMALIDDRFNLKPFQDTQMKVVHEWCEAIFNEFFDREAAAQLVTDMYNGQTIDKSSLPKPFQDYIEDRYYNKLYNTRKEIPSAEEFKSWFVGGENQEIAEQAEQYLMQAFMMRLQISNANNEQFYKHMFDLSQRILEECGQNEKIKASIHKAFQEALGRLLPQLTEVSLDDLFVPIIDKGADVPGVNYSRGPYIG